MSLQHISTPLPSNQPGNTTWAPIPVTVSAVTLPAIPGTGGSGQTPIVSNYTESAVFGFTGPWGATIKNMTIRINRTGTNVTVSLTGIAADVATATAPMTSTTGVAAWARPAVDTVETPNIQDTTFQNGCAIISASTGVITIYQSGARASFTSGNTVSATAFTFNYIQA